MTFSFLEYRLLKQQTHIDKTETTWLTLTLSLFVSVAFIKENSKNLLGSITRKTKRNVESKGDNVIKFMFALETKEVLKIPLLSLLPF